MTTRWTKADWLIVLGVIAVAACFRLWRLDQTPPGFQFDEAYNAADALRILGGERPLFFEANGGREALYVYLIAPFIAAFGVAPLALHLASALVGIASVALAYALWRRFLPDSDRGAAALAALFMAVSYWHIHFSRYGIRAILMPLALGAIFYALWAATMPGARREWVIARAARNWRAAAGSSLAWLALCGVELGLSIYAHPAARFIPVIIVLWYAWLWWQRADSPLRHFAPVQRAVPLLRDLLVIGAASFAVFLPLGVYFWRNPGAFVGHPTVVAITDQRVAGSSVLGAFGANAIAVAGMFFVNGDTAWIHNLAGRPVFDVATALFFAVGLFEWARRLRAGQPVAVFLAIWLPVMLLPTLLSDGAPNFSRAIGMLPALFLLPAWGAVQAFHLLRSGVGRLFAPRAAAWLAGGVCAVAVLAGALSTYHDYFDVFPARPELYVAYDVDKEDAAHYLTTMAVAYRVYTPPLLAGHATFALLTRDAGFKSFDNGEVVVLPTRDAQRGMLYAFPADADRAYMDEFERTYGALAQKQVVPGRLGQPLLVVYTIAPQAIPATAEGLPPSLPVAPKRLLNADFDGEVRLAGYRVEDSPDRQKPFHLTLVWQALKPIARDYTLFIHLSDAGGKRISQRDRRPGNGSYPTTVWSPGDIVIETYEVWPESARGPLQFAVGWYDRTDGARARVLDAVGHPVDDHVTIPTEATP